MPDGSFDYTGRKHELHLHIVRPMACETSTATVDLTINPASNIALTVQDPDGIAVTDYRWTIEEDNMWQPDPTLPAGESLATNFHRSYMPVVAKGMARGGADHQSPLPAALDPTKHYYVSVLPADAVAERINTLVLRRDADQRRPPSAAPGFCPALPR